MNAARRHRTAAAAAFGAALLWTAPAPAQEFRSGPSSAGSIEPGDLVVGGQDPDHLEFGTDWDEVTASIGDPTERIAAPSGFDEHEPRGARPGYRPARTHSLMELGEKLDGSELRSAPSNLEETLPPPPEDASASLMASWRALRLAEARLGAANAAYQDMRQTDYPRGEQRRWIIETRNAAISAAARARSRYAAALRD